MGKTATTSAISTHSANGHFSRGTRSMGILPRSNNPWPQPSKFVARPACHARDGIALCRENARADMDGGSCPEIVLPEPTMRSGGYDEALAVCLAIVDRTPGGRATGDSSNPVRFRQKPAATDH